VVNSSGEPAAGPCGTVAVEAGGVVPEVFALPVSAGLLEQAANKSTAEIAITTLNRIFEPFEPRPLGEAFAQSGQLSRQNLPVEEARQEG
jgi:hypothetical protein